MLENLEYKNLISNFASKKLEDRFLNKNIKRNIIYLFFKILQKIKPNFKILPKAQNTLVCPGEWYVDRITDEKAFKL
jgi:hypothetical protein